VTRWEMLLARLRAARRWPLPDELVFAAGSLVWAALRENDEPAIRTLMRWPNDRPLVIDNLGEKIASAYGDLLFGAEPWSRRRTRPTQDATSWSRRGPASCPPPRRPARARARCGGACHERPGLDHPGAHLAQPDGTSCRYLTAATCWPQRSCRASTAATPARSGGTSSSTARASSSTCSSAAGTTRSGPRRPRPAPRDREPARALGHGLPGMLCGRIVNRWGRRPHHGVSIYKGVWTRLLALNERDHRPREHAPDREEARRRARRRCAALPSKDDPAVANAIRRQRTSRHDGRSIRAGRCRAPFDAGEDVLVTTRSTPTRAAAGRPPFRVLEYSFDAER
jgi:hypothetical protein